jgi:hypothetical protein
MADAIPPGKVKMEGERGGDVKDGKMKNNNKLL